MSISTSPPPPDQQLLDRAKAAGLGSTWAADTLTLRGPEALALAVAAVEKFGLSAPTVREVMDRAGVEGVGAMSDFLRHTDAAADLDVFLRENGDPGLTPGQSWRVLLAQSLQRRRTDLVAWCRAHAVAMPGHGWLVRQGLVLLVRFAGPPLLDVLISALLAQPQAGA